MGWEAVQPGTPSAVVGQPSRPEPSPQQTALAGHDVKTASPGGCRQAITQAFAQFGRKLSSLVSASPSGHSRLPDTASVERSTRKQLVSLLKRVDSCDWEDSKLGAELDKLEDLKKQWLQSPPGQTEQQFDEMVRDVLVQHFPGKKIRHLEKTVDVMAGPDFAHLPHTPLRQRLAALVQSKVRDYRSVEALKAHHKNEIHRMSFDQARKIAGGIFWKGPMLAGAVKAFDKATKDCEYRPGATEADLQAAREALEEAGDRLLDALDARSPKASAPALRRRLFGDQNWTAIAVKARNQTQADLYAQFAGDYLRDPRNSDAVARKSAQVKALRIQLAHDVPRQRGALRSAEEQYFVRLRKKLTYLEDVRATGELENDDDMKELRDALARLPTRTSGKAKNADGGAPDYAAGLQALEQAIAAADRKIATRVALTLGHIDELEQAPPDTPERAETAQWLVSNTPKVVLSRLPPEAQLRLMTLMRGDLTRQPPQEERWKPFAEAQAKLYHAMELRPELLTHEKQLRRDVMIELEKDKKTLQEARDLWHTYTPQERRAVLMHIAKVHSKVLGCEPPDNIVFTSDPKVSGYEWQRNSGRILVGTAGAHYLDFEHMMDGVFHENTHNWQDQIMKAATSGDATQRALYEQALIFEANQPFYVDSSYGYIEYRTQPLEAHAFHSGRRLAADLMRMLAS
jgi:ribosomal protein L29